MPPEELSQGIRYLREQAQAAGRDVAEVPVSLSFPLGASTVRGYALGTDPGEIVQKVQAFARLGVETIVVYSGNTGDMAEILRAMDMLAREVLPVVQ